MNNNQINQFIYSYKNNILNQLQDIYYLNENNAETILQILSVNKDKIQIANEIILKTGKILPLFSLQFNYYYLYDINITYQNCNYIYKHFNTNIQVNIQLLYLYTHIYNIYKYNKLLNMDIKQLKKVYYNIG